jgi:isoleucyl-tRNA synthetase
VVTDTYVTATEGTGIVHQAPAFGEDDHRIAIASGILQAGDQPPCPIDDIGVFTSEVVDFVGLYVKVSFYDTYIKNKSIIRVIRMQIRISENT